jgi:hypothetical protein
MNAPTASVLLYKVDGQWHRTLGWMSPAMQAEMLDRFNRARLEPVPGMSVLPEYADAILDVVRAADVRKSQDPITGRYDGTQKTLDNGEAFLPMPDATGHP